MWVNFNPQRDAYMTQFKFCMWRLLFLLLSSPSYTPLFIYASVGLLSLATVSSSTCPRKTYTCGRVIWMVAKNIDISLDQSLKAFCGFPSVCLNCYICQITNSFDWRDWLAYITLFIPITIAGTLTISGKSDGLGGLAFAGACSSLTGKLIQDGFRMFEDLLLIMANRSCKCLNPVQHHENPPAGNAP